MHTKDTECNGYHGAKVLFWRAIAFVRIGADHLSQCAPLPVPHMVLGVFPLFETHASYAHGGSNDGWAGAAF